MKAVGWPSWRFTKCADAIAQRKTKYAATLISIGSQGGRIESSCRWGGVRAQVTGWYSFGLEIFLDQLFQCLMKCKTRLVLLKRLDPYWKMEAANVLLVPFFVLWLSDGQLSWIAWLPLAATMLLLLIGALYWRGKVQQLRAEVSDFPVLLRKLAACRRPALLLTQVGCVASLLGWVVPAWSAGIADRWAATGCAILAVLEYINYYHRQLQHFDNREDFRRLLTGRGFRRSWLARDLDSLDEKTAQPD